MHYYGNADPEGETVTVGGNEHVVGGWAAYELDRRRVRPHRYGGRARITTQDVVESVVGGGRGPLPAASARLAEALDRLAASAPEIRVAPGRALPVVAASSADVAEAAEETDVGELAAMGSDFALFAACLRGGGLVTVGGSAEEVPGLPDGEADANDPRAVSELEEVAREHIEALEAARARVARQFDEAADAIESRLLPN